MLEVITSCRIAVIDEIYQNYELQEMVSIKKAQKIRIRGTEILMNFLQGLLKIRELKQSLNELDKATLAKFLNAAIPLC